MVFEHLVLVFYLPIYLASPIWIQSVGEDGDCYPKIVLSHQQTKAKKIKIEI